MIKKHTILTAALIISCSEGAQMGLEGPGKSIMRVDSDADGSDDFNKGFEDEERIAEPVSVGGSYLTCFQYVIEAHNDVSCTLLDIDNKKADFNKKAVKQISVVTDKKEKPVKPKIIWHKDNETQHFSFLLKASMGEILSVDVESLDGKSFKADKPEKNPRILSNPQLLFYDNFNYERSSDTCMFSPCYYMKKINWDDMHWVESECEKAPRIELWNEDGKTWAELYSDCAQRDASKASLHLSKNFTVETGGVYKIYFEYKGSIDSASLEVTLEKESIFDEKNLGSDWNTVSTIYKADKTGSIKLQFTDKTEKNSMRKGSLITNVKIEKL